MGVRCERCWTTDAIKIKEGETINRIATRPRYYGLPLLEHI